MSAHLIATCRVAEGSPASVPERVLRADSAREHDPYAPPAEGGGLIDFVTNTQVILGLTAGAAAAILLVGQVCSGHRDKRLEPGERERPGSAADFKGEDDLGGHV